MSLPLAVISDKFKLSLIFELRYFYFFLREFTFAKLTLQLLFQSMSMF